MFHECKIFSGNCKRNIQCSLTLCAHSMCSARAGPRLPTHTYTKRYCLSGEKGVLTTPYLPLDNSRIRHNEKTKFSKHHRFPHVRFALCVGRMFLCVRFTRVRASAPCTDTTEQNSRQTNECESVRMQPSERARTKVNTFFPRSPYIEKLNENDKRLR